MSRMRARLIVPADTDGEIIVCREGLSFWGGVDPDTGMVIDAHHDLCGHSLAGKIVLMRTSRGSCSGSGVLLQLALNGRAPAALVFCEEEEILTLGASIASRMFEKMVGVVRVSAADYELLCTGQSARIRGHRLCTESHSVDLEPVSGQDLELTSADRAKLAGAHGAPVQLAMEVICAVAASQGARRLIDVSRGHIDGCIYAHEANLVFAERMAEMGAKVSIPTTINAISVDRENWMNHGMPPDFGRGACRLADAYVCMGAEPTFTCAPYLAPDVPRFGENIGWSESNAVIFANSVLGARTAKHPDYFDLFVALTGRAPETGVYLTENRRPEIVLDVVSPVGFDDAFWPLLGWVAGRLAPDRVPVLTGLEAAAPSRDDLRSLCAAFGTTSAAPLIHLAGITPEASLATRSGAERKSITVADLRGAWEALNTGTSQVDLVALGSPHLSLAEARALAKFMSGKKAHVSTDVIVTLGRDVRAQARAEGIDAALRAAGVQLISDLCWCSISEPVFPVDARTLMTNSGKYAHYAPGLCGRKVRFGSLAECAAAAVSGVAKLDLPDWLR